MYDIGTGGGEFDFDYTLVVGLDPVPTGGSITIGGPVSTGLFQAAAGGDLTTQAITAQTDRGQRRRHWRRSTAYGRRRIVDLSSNDINIGAAGGISGGADGKIRLVSTNATQALIGDGLTGTGYALSNAEFGRIRAGNVQISRGAMRRRRIDMLIGDLTVTGPAAGSTIEDSAGHTGLRHRRSRHRRPPGGVIRVVGDVVATGFGRDQCDRILCRSVRAGRGDGLDLDHLDPAATLGGELGLYADRIHVAERDDPRPAGRRPAICRLSGRPQRAGRGAAAGRRAQRREPSGSSPTICRAS